MSPEKSWKPLTITGLILILNGLIFSIISFTLQNNTFLGLAIGCLGSGVPLLIIGLLQRQGVKRKVG